VADGVAARETGDRAFFLARLRERAARPHEPNHAHPPPPPNPVAPEIRYRRLDPESGRAVDLVDLFARVATDQNAVVHHPPTAVPDPALVARLVDEHQIRTAIVSAEPAARTWIEPLRTVGVDVSTSIDTVEIARADLGVTSAIAAIAATGSLVVDCAVAGSRTISLLPRVHVCVVDAGQIIASPGDVLRGLGSPERPLPSNLVLISGPSRTGDIEQLLTLGVHGPIALHVVVTGVSGA